MTVYRRNEDGSFTPAEPLEWQEEHPWLVRVIYRLLGVSHCGKRWRRA